MLDMVKKDILPSVSAYSKEIANTLSIKKTLGTSCAYEEKTLSKLCELTDGAYELVCQLENASSNAESISDVVAKANYYKDSVIDIMNKLRVLVDELETITCSDYWPYPSYGELLFGIK